MTAHEVQRALRLITSKDFRRQHHFPITVLSQLSGLSRQAIYQARAGNGLTHRVITVLTPLLLDILAGKISAAKRWQVERDKQMSGRGR